MTVHRPGHFSRQLQMILRYAWRNRNFVQPAAGASLTYSCDPMCAANLLENSQAFFSPAGLAVSHGLTRPGTDQKVGFNRPTVPQTDHCGLHFWLYYAVHQVSVPACAEQYPVHGLINGLRGVTGLKRSLGFGNR
jgi:hypothetical protein